MYLYLSFTDAGLQGLVRLQLAFSSRYSAQSCESMVSSEYRSRGTERALWAIANRTTVHYFSGEDASGGNCA